MGSLSGTNGATATKGVHPNSTPNGKGGQKSPRTKDKKGITIFIIEDMQKELPNNRIELLTFAWTRWNLLSKYSISTTL